MADGRRPVRLHVPGVFTAGETCALPAVQAHHAARVLRLRAGDAVTLFDGEGREHAAVITRVERGAVEARIESAASVDRESPLEVTLAQAVSSGERMDYTLQKATELGVTAIQPLVSRRSIVRLAGARAAQRRAHWQGVAVAACAQCGRNRVPAVEPLESLASWLARPAPRPALRLLLAPGAATSLRELERPQAVVLLAGPEGGFDEDEVRAAQRAGFTAVRLGPRVLRTETAAVAALAAMQALWGDF